MVRKPIISHYIRIKGRRLDPASCRIELVKAIVYPAIYEKDENGEIIPDKEPIERRTYNEEVYNIQAMKCTIRYDEQMGWLATLLDVPIDPKIEAIIEKTYSSDEEERQDSMGVPYEQPRD